MDFKAVLEKDHSKQTTNLIVQYIEDNPTTLAQLMELFLNGELRISQRASWPAGDLGIKQPKLFLPFLPAIIENMDKPVHDAVLRNTTRILGHIDIPEEYLGEVYEKCFNFLSNPKQALAIRVFSMTVLTNIADTFPDLKDELIAVIEEHYPHGSAGYKSRAKRCLKQLKQKSK